MVKLPKADGTTRNEFQKKRPAEIMKYRQNRLLRTNAGKKENNDRLYSVLGNSEEFTGNNLFPD